MSTNPPETPFSQTQIELDPQHPIEIVPLQTLQDRGEKHIWLDQRRTAIAAEAVPVSDQVAVELTKVLGTHCAIRTTSSHHNVNRVVWDEEAADYLWVPAAATESHANIVDRSRAYAPNDRVRSLTGSPVEIHGLLRMIDPGAKTHFVHVVGKFDGQPNVSMTSASLSSQPVEIVTPISDPLTWEHVEFNPKEDLIIDPQAQPTTAEGFVSMPIQVLGRSPEQPKSQLSVPLGDGSHTLEATLWDDGISRMSHGGYEVSIELKQTKDVVGKQPELYKAESILEIDGLPSLRWKPVRQILQHVREGYYRKKDDGSEQDWRGVDEDLVMVRSGNVDTIYKLSVQTNRRDEWCYSHAKVSLEPQKMVTTPQAS